jgi:hypothetical protein
MVHKMPSEAFSISLSGLSDREKEKAAADLMRALRDSDPTASVDRRPENDRSQDFGATLVLILGSGASIAIARGIANWMGRWKNASITVDDGTRKVKLENVSSGDAVRVAELFAGNRRKT